MCATFQRAKSTSSTSFRRKPPTTPSSSSSSSPPSSSPPSSSPPEEQLAGPAGAPATTPIIELEKEETDPSTGAITKVPTGFKFGIDDNSFVVENDMTGTKTYFKIAYDKEAKRDILLYSTTDNKLGKDNFRSVQQNSSAYIPKEDTLRYIIDKHLKFDNMLRLNYLMILLLNYLHSWMN